MKSSDKRKANHQKFSLRKCFSNFYSKELYSTLKSVEINLPFGIALLFTKGVIIVCICILQIESLELIKYDGNFSFMKGSWINNFKTKASTQGVYLMLSINCCLAIALLVIFGFWVASSVSRIQQKNKNDQEKTLISPKSILLTFTKNFFSILISSYIYVIQAATLWVSFLKPGQITSIINLILTVLLGLLSADTDYSYVIKRKQSLAKSLDLINYLRLPWEILLMIIIRIAPSSSIFMLAVYAALDIGQTLYNPFYEQNIQRYYVFQSLFVLMISVTANVARLFRNSEIITISSIFLCIGLPLSWKISDRYMNIYTQRQEERLIQAGDGENVSILELNYLLRSGFVSRKKEVKEAQKILDLEQLNSIRLLLLNGEENDTTLDEKMHQKKNLAMKFSQALQTQDSISQKKEQKKNILLAGANHRESSGSTAKSSEKLILETQQFGETFNNYENKNQLSQDMNSNSDNKGRNNFDISMKQTLMRLFSRQITKHKLSSLKSTEIAIYFAFLVEEMTLLKMYWVLQKLVKSMKNLGLKDKQILQSIKKFCFELKREEFEQQIGIPNPFSVIYKEVLLFEKKIHDSWEITEQTISAKNQILMQVKEREINLAALIEKLEAFIQLRDQLKSNLKSLVVLNNQNCMLQELKAVYFEALAFSKNDLDISSDTNLDKINLVRQSLHQNDHKQDRFDKNSCILSAQYLEGGNLKISQVSSHFSQILSTSFQRNEDIIGQNIDILIPEFLHSQHKENISKYFMKEDSMLQKHSSRMTSVFAAMWGLFVRPVSVDIKLNTFDIKGNFGFCAKITLPNSTKQYILYSNESGRILGITYQVAKTMFSQPENLNKLNIYTIIPVLMRIGEYNSCATQPKYDKTNQQTQALQIEDPRIQALLQTAEQYQKGEIVEFLYLCRVKGFKDESEVIHKSSKEQDNNHVSPNKEGFNASLELNQFQFKMLQFKQNHESYGFIQAGVCTIEITHTKNLEINKHAALIFSHLESQVVFLKAMPNQNYHIPLAILENLLRQLELLENTHKIITSLINNPFPSGDPSLHSKFSQSMVQNAFLAPQQRLSQGSLKNQQDKDSMIREQGHYQYELGQSAQGTNGQFRNQRSSENLPSESDIEELSEENKQNSQSQQSMRTTAKKKRHASHEEIHCYGNYQLQQFSQICQPEQVQFPLISSPFETTRKEEEFSQIMASSKLAISHIINNNNNTLGVLSPSGLSSSRSTHNFLRARNRLETNTSLENGIIEQPTSNHQNNRISNISNNITRKQLRNNKKSNNPKESANLENTNGQHEENNQGQSHLFPFNVTLSQVSERRFSKTSMPPFQQSLLKMKSKDITEREEWRNNYITTTYRSQKSNFLENKPNQNKQNTLKALNSEEDWSHNKKQERQPVTAEFLKAMKTRNDIISASSKQPNYRSSKQLMKSAISDRSTPVFIEIFNIIGVISFTTLIITIILQYVTFASQIQLKKEDKFYSTWPVDLLVNMNSLIKDNNILYMTNNNDFTFSSNSAKQSFIQKTKKHLTDKHQNILDITSLAESSASDRLVFELMRNRQDIYKLSVQYNSSALVGAPSTAQKYNFPYLNYTTSLLYSIYLSFVPSMRYTLGLNGGRPEYFVIISGLDYNNLLGEVQKDLLSNQLASDDSLQTELTMVMSVVISVSAMCLLIIIPLFGYVQLQKQNFVSLYGTFQVSTIDRLLIRLQITREYVKSVSTLKSAQSNQSYPEKYSSQNNRNIKVSQKNAKNISQTTSLPKTSLLLTLKLSIVFGIIIIYPIVNKIIAQRYLQEETLSLNNTSNTILILVGFNNNFYAFSPRRNNQSYDKSMLFDELVNLYELKSYIVETMAFQYNNLDTKLYPAPKFIHLVDFLIYTQNLIDKAANYESKVLRIVQQQTQHTWQELAFRQFKRIVLTIVWLLFRHDQEMYQQFFYEIMNSNICEVLDSFPQFISNSTILNQNDCQQLHNGILKKGLQVAFKEFLSIFPQLQAFYLIPTTDPGYNSSFQQILQLVNLADFTGFEEFLEEILTTLKSFMLEMSENEYTYISTFQLTFFSVQILLLIIIFFVGWTELSADFHRQLFQAKGYLSMIDLETLIENPYVVTFIKKRSIQ